MSLPYEVVKHSLLYISEEMGVALRKSAFSPNIRERADHSCAILDWSGRLIGQAEHIPVHIGSLPHGLKNTLAYLEKKGVEMSPGDMYVLNDPYIAGTHLNDITTIRPIFYRGELVAYVANKAHHVDVGGIDPSSISIRAETLLQEGIVIPPVKLMKENKIMEDVVDILRNNTRIPDITLGDLRAQIAANLIGEKKLLDLIDKVSLPVFREAVEQIIEKTNQLVRQEVSQLPWGRAVAEDFLELDDRDLVIKAEVEVGSHGFRVNFAGTDRQVNKPLNAVLGVTIAATTYTIRTLLGPDILLNEGFTETLSIHAPEGTLVNPVKPAPVAAGNLETSQRIVDTIYKALSEIIHDRIPAASTGSMNNLMMGGTHPETGRAWAFYETIGGGGGARPGMDGVDGIHCHMTNTLNTPIEVIEHYYPVLFMSYRFRDGSGGVGRWRGGMGIERSLKALAPLHVAVMGDRSRHRPWGLKGGGEGAPSEYLIKKANGTIIKLSSKDVATLNPGDTLIIRTAGGGGYGRIEK
ncbi:MAG: hydantoinase B/oxoprolinase family protein [Candidatus Caldarchaeum sp.]